MKNEKSDPVSVRIDHPVRIDVHVHNDATDSRLDTIIEMIHALGSGDPVAAAALKALREKLAARTQKLETTVAESKPPAP